MIDTAIPSESMTTIHSEWKSLSIELLNDIFSPLSAIERIQLLYKYFDVGEVLLTSSFGTKSAVLLSMISKVNREQTIHFIDTTFHFSDTLRYRDRLVELLNLKVVNIEPQTSENALTREEKWWKDHPKMCCTINKVAPLEPIKAKHKVWISGLMSYQTKFRSTLRIFEQQGDIIKFHPLIDLEPEAFQSYFDNSQLPQHPLEAFGYGSVGCIHCTKKGHGRDGRWAGSTKTECGLHPGYFLKNKNKNK